MWGSRVLTQHTVQTPGQMDNELRKKMLEVQETVMAESLKLKQ